MADVAVTAASVAWTGKQDVGIAGATVTRGQALYRDATTNKLLPADADIQAMAVFAGFALTDAANNQPVVYGYGEGDLTVGGTGVTVGTIYVVSVNAGGIAPQADLLAGDFVTYLGVGLTTSSIRCAPHTTNISR